MPVFTKYKHPFMYRLSYLGEEAGAHRGRHRESMRALLTWGVDGI